MIADVKRMPVVERVGHVQVLNVGEGIISLTEKGMRRVMEKVQKTNFAWCLL